MGLMFEASAHTPGCHAFIVGVDEYLYLRGDPGAFFGFGELTAAALSAHHVYQWLLQANLARPLGSVRLLLSPAPGAPPDPGTEPCTLENFIRDAYQWRSAAETHRDNIAFLYFAGLGFSLTQGEQLLLLQDFNNKVGPLLRNAVSLNNLVYGMTPALSPEIARTQLFLVDASRTRLPQLPEYQSLNATAVFDASVMGTDDRTAAIFYATSPGLEAYTQARQPSFFSRALVEGLDGAAAQPTEDADSGWAVTVQSLAHYVRVRVQELASESGVTQLAGVEGSLGPAPISYLTAPPAVEVSIDIKPVEAAAAATVTVFDDDGEVVRTWNPGGPQTMATLPAGLYQIDVSSELAGEPLHRRKTVALSPPIAKVGVNLKYGR